MIYWQCRSAIDVSIKRAGDSISSMVFSRSQSISVYGESQFLYPIIFTSFAMFAEALQGYVNGLFLISIVTVGIFVYFSGGKIPSLTARTN